jgi:hypothetical protein
VSGLGKTKRSVVNDPWDVLDARRSFGNNVSVLR